MDHQEKARELFLSGYNCAQAVFGAFCDVTGMEFPQAMRLCSTMGGGIGGLREVCGAVSGACLVAGLLWGDEGIDQQKKEQQYARVQKLAAQFKDQHNSLICRELLQSLSLSPQPQARTASYYKARPCLSFVEDMALILDQMISDESQAY